jgi:hypothetical protein
MGKPKAERAGVNELNLSRNRASLLAKTFGVGFIDLLDDTGGKSLRLPNEKDTLLCMDYD